MEDMFYNRTVTIFNRLDGEEPLDDDTWFVTVLKNVRLVETQGRNITTSGLVDADAVRMHIMLDSLSKPYLDPIEWKKLLVPEEAFTLAGGRDFFVVGDITADLDDIPADRAFEYVKENYDGVYRITNVDKYTVIPHLEVGGR